MMLYLPIMERTGQRIVDTWWRASAVFSRYLSNNFMLVQCIAGKLLAVAVYGCYLFWRSRFVFARN